jgi:hypothetical protein
MAENQIPEPLSYYKPHCRNKEFDMPKEGTIWLLLEIYSSHHWLIFGTILLRSIDQGKGVLQNKSDLVSSS